MEDKIGLIEILQSSPEAALVFGGMALAIAFLFYLLLKRDIRHIEKLLTNHITETNGKIEDLKVEVRENRKELKEELKANRTELKAEIQANEARAEAWRKEQKAEAKENEARAEAWRKEQKSDAKENAARLEKKLDKILERRD